MVCVIGDGAMSAGMAYEAMNNAGALGKRLIVILNDNDMSIAPPVGAFSAYLARRLSGRTYSRMRDLWEWIAKRLPQRLARFIRRAFVHGLGFLTGGTLFEQLGFEYVGPIDGHNLDHLLPVLQERTRQREGPDARPRGDEEGQGLRAGGSLRRQVSRRGQVRRHDRRPGQGQGRRALLHQGVRREPDQARRARTTRSSPSRRRCRRAPASISSRANFPRRFFDVGIAEQHAVTFAGGLATEGFKPFAAIYSTFLQRAYDQVVHDVAIQRLPVRFAIDRAGLVGADGPTHAGSFDVAYLSCLPGFVVMAAADEAELVHMVATAAAIDDRPSRVPLSARRGDSVCHRPRGTPLEIGRGRIVREGTKVAILSFGARLCANACRRRRARRPRPFHDRRRRAVRQAARPRPDAAARPRARGAGDYRRRLGRRLRQPRAGGARPRRRARSRTEAPAAWCCPTSSSSRIRRRAMYARAGLDARAIASTALSALGRDALGAVRRA